MSLSTTSLAGYTAFITGASRGIGRSIALRLAKAGANVVLAAKTSDPHPKLAGTIHSVAAEVEAVGGKALAVQCDVRFEESVQAAIDAGVKAFGGIDFVVAVAALADRVGLKEVLLDAPLLPHHPFRLVVVVGG